MTGTRTTHGTHSPYEALTSLGLGDLVTLPDGTFLTVRSIERQLQVPVGSMHGFVLGGEIGPQATMLSVPSGPRGTVYLYTPVESVPAGVTGVQQACWGVISYWAPHLPGLSGALGELTYRVFRIRGQVEPLVIVWRGEERIVFVRSGAATPDELEFLRMQVDEATTEHRVVRHTARVTNPANVPAPAPVPAETGRRSLIRR